MSGGTCKVKPFSVQRSGLLQSGRACIRMPRPTRPMPNIYDVARRARVSAATVSAVLNDSAFVSPGLKARVQDAVAALGYEPNLLARGLAKRQTKTIAMIVPDIANPFFPEVVR